MRTLSKKLSKFENHLIETAYGAILMLKRSLYCVLWQLQNLGSMNNETGRREGRGAVKRFFVIFSGATPQLTISVNQECFKSGIQELAGLKLIWTVFQKAV